MSDSRATRYSLIRRACDPTDQEAWVEFDRIYRRFISYILTRLGVAAPDVEDLTQQILVTLTRDLRGYDPGRAGFRTWLSAVIRHAALAHLRRVRQQHTAHALLGAELESPDHPSNESELDRRIEAEWATYVATLAMERVREKFQGAAMEVFELTLDELPIEEIARRTGLTTASVYTLRKRVKKRLYLEIRAFIQELEPS